MTKTMHVLADLPVPDHAPKPDWDYLRKLAGIVVTSDDLIANQQLVALVQIARALVTLKPPPKINASQSQVIG